MKFRLLCWLLLPAVMLNAQSDTAPVSGKMQAKKTPAHASRMYELPDPLPFSKGITPADLKVLVDSLASKTFAGRETGQEGQRLAADYIAQQFKALDFPRMGDKNSYFQNIVLQNQSWKDVGLKVGSQEFKSRTDFIASPAYNTDKPSTTIKEVMFIGYGIDDPKYSDYKKADVEGKAVIFYEGEPLDAKGNSLLTGSEYRSTWALDWRKKVQTAKAKGASMALIVVPDLQAFFKASRKSLAAFGWQPVSADSSSMEKKYVNSVFISQAVADAILGKKAEKAQEAMTELREKGEYKPVKAKTDLEVRMDKESRQLKGSNVIGFIEGSDPKLKKEYVFVTAHYDHLGKVDDIIYHGADDNASGTSSVIEIARAFHEAKKAGVAPKRSMVFMLVSGEEKGLLGSKFYTEFPIFPLDKTVIDINIDMVGRVDDAHADNPNYVYVIGSDRMSTDLHRASEQVTNDYTEMELNYKYNAKDDPNHYYERSDHFNFAEKGVPVIFYFNGTHADYHKPTDTPDKINFEACAKRAQLAFYMAWDAANRPWRYSVDNQESKKDKE